MGKKRGTVINCKFLPGQITVGSHAHAYNFFRKGCKPALPIVLHLGQHTFEMPEVIPLEDITTLNRAQNLNYPGIHSLPCFLPPSLNLPLIPSLIPNA